MMAPTLPRSASKTRLALTATLAALGATALVAAVREQGTVAIEQAAAVGGPTRPLPCASNEAPRRALARMRGTLQSLARASRARDEDALTAIAETCLAAARAGRSDWAAATIEESLLAYRRGEPERVLAALSRSYAQARFLRSAALWRVALAGEFWPALSPADRRAAIAEARWYAGIDWASRTQMARAVAGTCLAEQQSPAILRACE